MVSDLDIGLHMFCDIGQYYEISCWNLEEERSDVDQSSYGSFDHVPWALINIWELPR